MLEWNQMSWTTRIEVWVYEALCSLYTTQELLTQSNISKPPKFSGFFFPPKPCATPIFAINQVVCLQWWPETPELHQQDVSTFVAFADGLQIFAQPESGEGKTQGDPVLEWKWCSEVEFFFLGGFWRLKSFAAPETCKQCTHQGYQSIKDIKEMKPKILNLKYCHNPSPHQNALSKLNKDWLWDLQLTPWDANCLVIESPQNSVRYKPGSPETTNRLCQHMLRTCFFGNKLPCNLLCSSKEKTRNFSGY